MKTIVAWVIVIILIAAGVWYYMTHTPPAQAPGLQQEEQGSIEQTANDPVIGSWRSNEDPNFTREFRADGTVEDRYAGDESATVSGTWEMIASADLSGLGLPQVDGTIIRVQFPEEAMYFQVNDSADINALSLTYLSGNGTLEFTRI